VGLRSAAINRGTRRRDGVGRMRMVNGGPWDDDTREVRRDVSAARHTTGA